MSCVMRCHVIGRKVQFVLVVLRVQLSQPALHSLDIVINLRWTIMVANKGVMVIFIVINLIVSIVVPTKTQGCQRSAFRP